MSEVGRIKDQLVRSHLGRAWHGPALGELLEGITDSQAAARVFPNAHNIQELLLHIQTWQSAVCRFLGGEVIDSANVEDWTARSEESESLPAVLKSLENGFADLCSALDEMPDSRLRETVQGQDYSFYVLLHGLIQHNLYHAGQIALLRKALTGGRR